jgi:hypothetical protein
VSPGSRCTNDNGFIDPGLSPGVLTIDGGFEQGPNARLLIEIGGTNSAAHDQLVVTGDAVLDGRLILKFVNGFAPRSGDRIPFLLAGGPVSGGFAQVDLQNLAPGFQFDLATNGSVLTITALNNATFDPSLPALIQVTVTNIGGISYAPYAITTSNVCHKIEYDGPLVRTGNTLRQGFRQARYHSRDLCFEEQTIETGALVLGTLAPGDYVLELTSDVQVLQSIPFSVPTGSGQTLAPPARRPDGRMRFRIDGPEGVPYRVEASRDLKVWEFLTDGELPENITDDASITNRMRFYRAIIGP